jgi:hypothetical protein
MMPDNRNLLDELRRPEAGTVEFLYSNYRKTAARAVEAAGGSHADGNTFFRIAVIHTCILASHNELPESTDTGVFLTNLSEAHFRDWASERALETNPPGPVAEAEIPDELSRTRVRKLIRARRQWLKLDKKCREEVQSAASSSTTAENTPCIGSFLKLIPDLLDPDSPASLPEVVVSALSNDDFNRICLTVDQHEANLALNQSPAKPAERKRNRTIAAAILLTAAAIATWTYFSIPKSAEAIFNENYAPPTSILLDRKERETRDAINSPLPAECEQTLQDADVYFKQKKWEDVIGVLLPMAGYENDICKSDALFYMAIAGLQLANPELSLECLSKISDIERYGEDLYWYQALAFVKIAADRPGKRSLARKAVERARSNTVIPERKVQAEKMLSELGD